MSRVALTASELAELKTRIAAHAAALGFQQVGVAGIDLGVDGERLEAWLAAGLHGDMDFMRRHGRKRTHPAELVPGTLRVLSLRMDCQSPDGPEPADVLVDGTRAYIARYALGRDYHHTVRRRLQKLADCIAADIGPFGYRAFVDSAPVLEKPLARNAGLGWIGKHTNLINERSGSMFVLGELFTDLPLPIDAPAVERCGSCSACLPACPTGAIVAPFRLDARRCISYLTIEYHGSIPVEFRAAIGNRIFGCDDCQLVCPWNKFARRAAEPGFRARHGLDAPDAAELLGWSEQDYLRRTEGSALRRLGYWRWLRNLAIALGNAPPAATALAALEARAAFPHEIVREHVAWAIGEQRRRLARGGSVSGPAA
jgi:epoxyqueuosine reductase